jgi:hypothetical protein
MRESVQVLYYPDMMPEQTALKKAVLFFDEIHFMDRPSFSCDGGLGTIGAQSRLRWFEHAFRNDGVPLYVHGVRRPLPVFEERASHTFLVTSPSQKLLRLVGLSLLSSQKRV